MSIAEGHGKRLQETTTPPARKAAAGPLCKNTSRSSIHTAHRHRSIENSTTRSTTHHAHARLYNSMSTVAITSPVKKSDKVWRTLGGEQIWEMWWLGACVQVCTCDFPQKEFQTCPCDVRNMQLPLRARLTTATSCKSDSGWTHDELGILLRITHDGGVLMEQMRGWRRLRLLDNARREARIWLHVAEHSLVTWKQHKMPKALSLN